MQKTYCLLWGLFLSLLVSTVANAALVDEIHVRKHGGSGGYDDITETHEWVFWPIKKLHKLTCLNPGTEDCKWDDAPSISAIPMAEDSIANGIYNGHLEYTFSGGVTSEVDWSGTSPYNVELYETVTYP